MRPYGFTSYYDTFKAALDYNLAEVAKEHPLPNANHRTGQRIVLARPIAPTLRLANFAEELVHFSENDGADLHCEPKGIGIRDLRVFNWLDEIL